MVNNNLFENLPLCVFTKNKVSAILQFEFKKRQLCYLQIYRIATYANV